jgi:DNA integrity scanning protein DisA with diadenylate cyclase activity
MNLKFVKEDIKNNYERHGTHDGFRVMKMDIEELIKTVEKQEIMINMHYQAEEEDEKTKQRLCDQIDFYINALREIDTHIRATGEPVSYIIKTLLKTLPEYTIEDEIETPRSLNDWMK